MDITFFVIKEVNLKKELKNIKSKIQKLKDKKALIDEELRICTNKLDTKFKLII